MDSNVWHLPCWASANMLGIIDGVFEFAKLRSRCSPVDGGCHRKMTTGLEILLIRVIALFELESKNVVEEERV